MTILPEYYTGNINDFIDTDSIDISIIKDEECIKQLKFADNFIDELE